MPRQTRTAAAHDAAHDVAGERLFTRRRVLQSAAACLLLPTLAPDAHAAVVAAVRVWPAQDYTRVTLEHDNDLKFSHFTLEDPHRLVVDIEGIDLNTTLRNLVSKITPNDPYIQSVRVGQNRPKVVRLVIDLKQPVAPQVFSLDPIAQFKYRLIFDLYPTTPRDPLLALLDKPVAPMTMPTPPPASTTPAPSTGVETASATLPSPPAGAGTAVVSPTVTVLAPDTTITSPPAPVNVVTAPSGPSMPSPQPPREDPKAREDKPATIAVSRLITIALDPGHGGEDPGAVGRGGSYEKDVVLKIARRVKQKLDTESGMRAMLTRDGDFFVPLPVRVQKARRVQADLMVSIHADAFITPQASGSSVFVLSERGATSSAAQWLAKKENDADLIGGVNLKTHDRDLARVLLDLSTTAQINDSLKLANAVLGHIGKINRLHKPQVEQAGFAVLKAPDIPSILIETAFISNPDEERRLNTTEFQEHMADSIVAGIKRYFAKNPPLAKSRLT